MVAASFLTEGRLSLENKWNRNGTICSVDSTEIEIASSSDAYILVKGPDKEAEKLCNKLLKLLNKKTCNPKKKNR